MQQSIFVKLATVCLFSVGSFSISLASFLVTKTATNNITPQIITDVSLYQEIRDHKWSNRDQIKHFPVNIPTNTKPISMAYSPGWRQSSSFFQLRLKQSPEQTKKLLNHYSQIAKYQYQGGDTNDHIKQPQGVPTTFFHTSQSHIEAFPNTYQIFVLKAQEQGQPGFKWNHGSSYGVAINMSSTEVVYWVEQW